MFSKLDSVENNVKVFCEESIGFNHFSEVYSNLFFCILINIKRISDILKVENDTCIVNKAVRDGDYHVNLIRVNVDYFMNHFIDANVIVIDWNRNVLRILSNHVVYHDVRIRNHFYFVPVRIYNGVNDVYNVSFHVNFVADIDAKNY